MKESPAGIACNPRVAGVKEARSIISPTDDQPPPRQEGEAVARPWLRQIRDGAGVGVREQLSALQGVDKFISAAHHHMS